MVTRDAARLARCVRFLQPAGSEATTVGRFCMAEFSQLALMLPLLSRIAAAAYEASAAAAAAAVACRRSWMLCACCAPQSDKERLALSSGFATVLSLNSA